MKRKWILISLTFVCLHLLLPFRAPDAIGASRKEDLFAPKGLKWAFCIGIGRFKDPQITALSKSRNDAKGLARILEEHGGFDHVFLFTDDLREQDPFFPSVRNIRRTLEEAVKRMKPEDLVVISYSGHGAMDPSGRAYLLTADTMIHNLPGTAISLESLFHLVKKSGVKQSILFLDAYREEGLKGKGISQGGIYPDRYLLLKDGIGAVLYAAKKGTSSHDDEASEYGVFAKSLIAGLGGEADLGYGGNHDGGISLRELADYVQEAISKWSLETHKRQKPYVAILDRDLEEMMISSVQKRPTSKQPLAAAALPRVEKMETRGEEDVLKKTESVEKKPPEPVKEEKEKETSPKKTEPEKVQQRPDETKEEIQKEVKVGPPAPTIEKIMQQEEAKKTGEEKPVIAKERPLDKEVPQEEKITEKPETEASPIREAALKKEVPRREPVSLRNRPADLSPKDIKAILMKDHFYATCWNYNGDFCNPDGDFENDLVNNKDVTVTDRATGLMWQKSGSPEGMTWSEARVYADRINRERFGGYSDWRIPTVEELASLMESS
ncbi:MAG: DUF1566 domain-containing protein, partial [Pseudomonadota bacterium]